MTLRTDIIALGQQLSDEDNAAHDLWTWLPSHKVARRHHGDYADEFTPDVTDIMKEAAMYIAYLKEGTQRDYTTVEIVWFETCPCGEDHP